MSLQSLLELYVNITDYDSIGDNDTVDDITIPLSGRLEADSQFSLSKTYSGSCGRASLAVKFRLTSLCPTNQYGPQCDKECIEEPQQTLCNYLGESVGLCPNGFNGDTTECRCEGHFLEPNCILCDEDYYPTGQCGVFCSPSDSDYLGHYQCNPESGERVCLEGYKDPSTLCVDEDENHGQFLEYTIALCFNFMMSPLLCRWRVRFHCRCSYWFCDCSLGHPGVLHSLLLRSWLERQEETRNYCRGHRC